MQIATTVYKAGGGVSPGWDANPLHSTQAKPNTVKTRQ